MKVTLQDEVPAFILLGCNFFAQSEFKAPVNCELSISLDILINHSYAAKLTYDRLALQHCLFENKVIKKRFIHVYVKHPTISTSFRCTSTAIMIRHKSWKHLRKVKGSKFSKQLVN